MYNQPNIYIAAIKIIVSKYCWDGLNEIQNFRVKQQYFEHHTKFNYQIHDNIDTILEATNQEFKTLINHNESIFIEWLLSFEDKDNIIFELQPNATRTQWICQVKQKPVQSIYYNTLENFAEHLTTVLLQFENKNTTIATIDICTQKEKMWLQSIGTNTNILQNDCQLLHQIFEKSTFKYSSNIAVEQFGNTFTYNEINIKANQYAQYLITQGLALGDCVAILLSKSVHTYISMLGILKAGGTYVPLDAAYPADRIEYIVNDSNATFIFTENKLLPLCNNLSCTVIVTEQLQQQLYTLPPLEQAVAIPASNIAYIIYTSGSTGRPKGVAIPHQSICNLIASEHHLFNANATDKILQGFSVAFDASLEEIWLAFNVGATLVAASETIMHDVLALHTYLIEKQITIFSTVPTLLSMMPILLPSLRILILGGEAAPQELLQKWHNNNLRIENTYGPTEATVICTSATFNPNKKINIGKPINNYKAFILNKENQMQVFGAPGELCIGGTCLADRYINNKTETTNKFINIETSPGFFERIYKTGDLAKWNENSEIEFLGRIDTQIKIRGYRVELSEIESQILQADGIINTAVLAKTDNQNITRLIAFLIVENKGNFDENTLKKYLSTRLAAYMMPTIYSVQDSLPILPSGKVDRKKLDNIEIKINTNHKETIAPQTKVENTILEIWQKYFPATSISTQDDFFDIGGHSLLASLVINDLRKIPEYMKASVQDVYKYPTIILLAEHLENISNTEKNKTKRTLNKSEKGWTYFFTGITQVVLNFAFYILASYGLLSVFIAHSIWPSLSLLQLIIVSVFSIIVITPLYLLLCVVLKWLLLGKIKPGVHKLWGWYYLRFWLVKKFIDAAPLSVISGTIYINIFYKLLGSKIGKAVHIGTDRIRAFDCISIGNNTSISKESLLMGYVVHNGELLIGNINIGNNNYIGTRACLNINTILGNNVYVDDLCMIDSEEKIPDNTAWQGSPFKTMEHPQLLQNATTHVALFKKVVFYFAQLLSIGYVLLFPLIVAIPFIYFSILNFQKYGVACTFLLQLPITTAYIITYSLLVALNKWIIIGKAKPETFSVYSIKYLKKYINDGIIFNTLTTLKGMYATIYMPMWLRLLGANIGKHAEVSTVNQLNPDLLTIGEGSFIADSVSMGATFINNGLAITKTTIIGKKTFIGNGAVISSGTVIGDECLIGVLSTAPKNIPLNLVNNSSWVGSPPFLLPNRQLSPMHDASVTFNPSKKLIFKRGVFEYFKIVLPTTFLSSILIIFYQTAFYLLNNYHQLHTLYVMPILLFVVSLICVPIAIFFKYILIGTYKPNNEPLWSYFVWKNELVNSICESLVYPIFVNFWIGTPFATIFFRLMGSKIGSKVYLETTEITEFDLVNIGDNVCINYGTTLQTHLFEDRVMKMDNLYINKYSSVGQLSVVLYNTQMGKGSGLHNLSLIMKGETIPAYTQWQGAPCQPK
jgi:non-ribosomal peptide synthetase-like protein